MSKRLSVTLTCPPSPSRLRKFHPRFVDDINIANIANAFQKSTPCSNRSQISKLSDIYMFGCADGRCLCSEDLRTFCGRVCFPLSATIIIQYISEKACCSPHGQLAEFVRVAALYTWSKKKKNNKNGCSAKVQKRQNTDFLSHQLSWSEPLVTNLMQNKPN